MSPAVTEKISEQEKLETEKILTSSDENENEHKVTKIDNQTGTESEKQDCANPVNYYFYLFLIIFCIISFLLNLALFGFLFIQRRKAQKIKKQNSHHKNHPFFW